MNWPFPTHPPIPMAQPKEPEQQRPQNCGTGFCSCIECVMEPEQEPVAKYTGETWCGSVVNLYEDIPLNTLLYTTPPQRTWVGLTDEEFMYFCSYVRADVLSEIEAKLKEKNT